MNKTVFKFAASTTIIGVTMVACTAQSEAMRRNGGVRRADSRADLQAADYHEQARRLLASGQVIQATRPMEQAVAMAPRDAGYRLLLADIYLKSGRFEAARATYADVIELDPSNTRAAMSLALMQISLGRPQAAIPLIDELSGRAPAADVGLAYALAGMPERAIEILEPAARSTEATPRLRQNLALSYALAGDWARARTIASQDVSPADLNRRLQQWAAMAHPDARSGQVAALLGISPVLDPGQPVQLALAPSAPAAPEALASAETLTPATNPIQTQAAHYLPAPEAPPVRTEEEVRFAVAAQTVNQPDPAVVRTAAVSLPTAPAFRRDVSQAVRRGNSNFVVQLGAFSNEGNAERAWQEAQHEFGLADHDPMTTTIDINGRTLHRVSVSGFAGQSDAARLCSNIRARGGACFVRANAGDASVRWAARYAQGRNRSA